MSIFAGVNGAKRKVTQLYGGVSGVRRTVTKGYGGVQGRRRQFFGPLEDVAAVEVRVTSLAVRSVDTSGKITETLTGNLATLNQYGSLTASGTTLRLQCNTIGKEMSAIGAVYAVFHDGHEVPLTFLADQYAKYGAEISFPITYIIAWGHSSSSWNVTGSYGCSCCGTLHDGYVNGGASGTKMAPLTDYSVFILTSLYEGYGGPYEYVELDFAAGITIDGRQVPVRVVSQLT